MVELDSVWAYSRHGLAHMSEESLANRHRNGNYNTSLYLLPLVLSLSSRLWESRITSKIKSKSKIRTRRYRELSLLGRPSGGSGSAGGRRGLTGLRLNLDELLF